MRVKGKIVSWNDEKGFGFITPSAGGKQVFVHIKAFSNRSRRPEINHVVIYDLSADKQGRPRATKATLAGDRLQQREKRNNGFSSVMAVGLFFIIVILSVATGKMSPLILALYIIGSLLTFIMYAADKSAARKGDWRTQESTLHLLSLAGGWPGALIAQQKLRHKSRKATFRAVFWVTVILNCSAFVWLLTPTGAATLQSLISSVV